MNVEIGAEAALSPEKEYINRIALAVHSPPMNYATPPNELRHSSPMSYAIPQLSYATLQLSRNIPLKTKVSKLRDGENL
jgi:hypothetical protein